MFASRASSGALVFAAVLAASLGGCAALTGRGPDQAGAPSSARSWGSRVPAAPRYDELPFEDARTGELYALHRDARFVVGSPGRFELEFADGVIVAWRGEPDVDAEGERPETSNLADRDGLGPWLVALPDDWAAPGSPGTGDPRWRVDWGPAVAASQRVVEQSRFRTVIEGRWRFVVDPERDAAPADVDARPGFTWRYTIYPHGAVYVHVAGHARGQAWPSARVGALLALRADAGFEPAAAAGHPGSRAGAAYVLAARPGRQRADMLWSWSPADLYARFAPLTCDDADSELLLVGDLAANDELRSAFLLRLWPHDLEGDEEARSLAADYQRPAALRVATGRVVTDAPGDADGDGFNEAEGCYELSLERRGLRAEFDPGATIRFDPIVRVRGVEDRQAYVYVRGRSVNAVGRDAENNLLVRLARAVSSRATIEIHTTGP